LFASNGARDVLSFISGDLAILACVDLIQYQRATNRLRRDISLTSYLRNARLYELPKVRTARYAKSFLPYCITHFTWF